MKRFLLLMLLVLPAACGNQYGNMKLGETYCAFPAPISALAASDTCLYIGTEAGTVARLYTEGMRFGNPMYIDYGHIYCIREAGPGRLLVGIRNKGLKLVRVHGDDSISVITDYAISPGRLTYSPYSFLIKKGNGCDTVFCGTSNGIYWYPLPETGSTAGDVRDTVLMFRITKNNRAEYRFNSMDSTENGEIYAGGNSGVVRIRNCGVGKDGNPSITCDTVFPGQVNRIHAYGDRLYWITPDGDMYVDGNGKRARKFRNKPLLFYRDGDYTFTVSDWTLTVGNENGEGRFRLPFRSAISGLNNRGRECFLKHGDFYYLATEKAVLKIPSHINIGNGTALTDVCPHTRNGAVFAITGNDDLYRISDGKSAFIRNIRPGKGVKVRHLAGIYGKDLVFATDFGVYRIATSPMARPKLIDATFRDSLKIQRVFLSEYGRLIVDYPDSTFIHNMKGGESFTIPHYDFYATAADFSNPSVTYIGTLNHGLWTADASGKAERAIIKGECPPLRAIYDICLTRDLSKLFILVPGAVHELDNNGNGWKYSSSAKVPYYATGLFLNGETPYITLSGGGVQKVSDGIFWPAKVRMPDMKFIGKDILSGPGTIIMSENGGLLNISEGLKPVFFRTNVPSGISRVLRWAPPAGLFLCIISVLALAIIIYSIAKHLNNENRFSRKISEIIRQREKDMARIKSLADNFSLLPDRYREDVQKVAYAFSLKPQTTDREWLLSEYFTIWKRDFTDVLNETGHRIASELRGAFKLSESKLQEMASEGRLSRQQLREYKGLFSSIDSCNLPAMCRAEEEISLKIRHFEDMRSINKSIRSLEAITDGLPFPKEVTEYVSTFKRLADGEKTEEFKRQYHMFEKDTSVRKAVADRVASYFESQGIPMENRFISGLVSSCTNPAQNTMALIASAGRLFRLTDSLVIIGKMNELFGKFVNFYENLPSRRSKVESDAVLCQSESFKKEYEDMSLSLYRSLPQNEKDLLAAIKYSISDKATMEWLILLTATSRTIDNLKTTKALCCGGNKYGQGDTYDSRKSDYKKRYDALLNLPEDERDGTVLIPAIMEAAAGKLIPKNKDKHRTTN